MKSMILRSLFFLFAAGMTFFIARPDLSCGEITVSDIRALVVEKGAENYSITVQAKVTNLGETDNITVAVIALDMNGYQLKDVFLNGRIEKGKTKILNTFVQIPKKTYEEIFNWEWRANK